MDHPPKNRAKDAERTRAENHEAFEKVRAQLRKLRAQICDHEETLAAVNNVLEDIRARREAGVRQQEAGVRGQNSGEIRKG